VLVQSFAPVGNAFAASGQYPGNGAPPMFMPATPLPNSGTIIQLPMINAVNLVDVDLQNMGTSNYAGIKVADGPRWISLNDEQAGARGLDPQSIATLMKRVNTKGSYVVYSKYFAENAQLAVEVYEAWYGSDRLYHLRKIQYTPLYGRFFAADRTLTTQAERDSGATVDPFAQFYSGDPTDPVFYNVSPQAASVILGAAMAKFQAPVGFMSVDVPDLQQWTTTSGNFLRKTTTTHTRGYASTSWFIAGTKEMNPHGTTSAICAVMVGNGTTCDAKEHVLNSGVSLMPWKGGNAPTNKDLLYSADDSSSSWTVAAFMIVAIALSAMGGYAAFEILDASGTLSAGGALENIAPALGYTGGTSAAISGGISGGAMYATDAFTQKGSVSLADAQANYYGQIQSGYQQAAQTNNPYLSALLSQIESKQIVASFGYGLTAEQLVLFGNCLPYLASATCQANGQNPGTIPRPDTIQEADNMRIVYQRYEYCKSNLNLTGSQLQQCAAPSLDLNDPTIVHYNSPDFN